MTNTDFVTEGLVVEEKLGLPWKSSLILVTKKSSSALVIAEHGTQWRTGSTKPIR